MHEWQRTPGSGHLSRRQFLVGGLGAAGLGLLAACSQAPAAAPTAAPAAAPTAAGPAATPQTVEKVVTQVVVVTATPGAAATTQAAPTAQAQAAPASQAKGEVIWTSWATDTYGMFRVQEQVAAFNTVYPNVKVTLRNEPSKGYYDKLLTNLAAGTGPDMFRCDWSRLPPLIRQNQVVQLDPLFQAQKDSWFAGDDLKPGIVDQFRYKGKLYAFPMGLDMPAFFINKNLFDADKVSYPPETYGDSSWTFPAMGEMAKKLTKVEGNHPVQFGADMPSTGDWYELEGVVAANGGRLTSEDLREFTWHTPEATDALQWIADLRNQLKAAPSPAQGQGGAFDFVNGHLALSWTEVSQAVYRTKDVVNKFNWDMLPWPTWPNKQQITILDPSSETINKATKNLDATWTFFQWEVGPGGQRITAEMGWALPIFKSLDSRYNVRIADFKKNIKPAVEGPKYLIHDLPLVNPRFGEAYDMISAALDNVWIGKDTAKNAMEKVKPKVDQLLQQGVGEM